MSANEILIYDVIGVGDSSAFAVREKMRAAKRSDPLVVRINSDGGSAFEGFAIFNALQEFPGTVNVFVDGIAASAATMPLLAADHVTVGPMSFVMIHESWGGVTGSKREVRKYAELLENVDTQAIQQYAQKMGKTLEEVQQLVEAETWFTAQQAIEAKLADAIAPQQRAGAFVESSPNSELKNRWGYKHVPASLLVDPSIAMTFRRSARADRTTEVLSRIAKVK